jgi:hypothetical protein
MYTRLHGVTTQRTVIFTFTTVITSVLTPGRSGNDTKRWWYCSTEQHWKARQHCWCQYRRGRVTLGSIHQWHLSSVADQLPAPSRILDTFNCQHDKVRDQECTCKELKTGIQQYFHDSSLCTIKVTIYQLLCSRILWLCEECKMELHM